MTSADARCKSGKHCAGKNKDGTAITTNPVCAACVQVLQKQLDELPHLATALHACLAVTPKTALQSRVNSTPEPACPIDTRVDELIGDIEDVCDRTDGLRVADLILQPAMEFVLWFRDRREARFLEGWQRALDIRRVHVRANNILGFDDIRVRLRAPCPNCSLPTLGTVVGGDRVDCSDEGCGYFTTRNDYDRYCCELAGAK